jgi:hypothetical protein
MMLENFLFISLLIIQIISIKSQIKIDKSKLDEFRCNDHQDRIRLNIDFLNSEENNKFFQLNYMYNCNHEKCDQYQRLTKFNFRKNVSFKLILNIFYEYKFEIVKAINHSNQTEFLKICKNDLNFTSFKNCEDYQFNIDNNNGVCSIDLIKKLKTNNFFIYIYMFIVSLLILTIVAVIVKFFAYKYHRLK